ILLLGSQSHSYANLVCALRDRISHHTVDSNRRQQQRDAGKDPEQHHRESFLQHRVRNYLLHRHHSIDRLVLVHFVDRFANRSGEPGRITFGSREQIRIALRALRLWEVILLFDFSVETIALDVLDDADDRAPVELAILAVKKGRDSFAYRILIRPVTRGKRLIDDRDGK